MISCQIKEECSPYPGFFLIEKTYNWRQRRSIYDELKVGHYDAFPITVLSFDKINEKGEYDFKLIGDPDFI